MFENCDNCDHGPIYTRRDFLSRLGMGFGALGLASLLNEEFVGNTYGAPLLSPLSPKEPHFPAKAKRVIHIFASGAPSQVDTWDPKSSLTTYDGKSIGGRGVAIASPFKFQA